MDLALECACHTCKLHWRKLVFPLPVCSRTIELDHVKGENCRFRTEQGRHTYEYTVTVEQAHDLYKLRADKTQGGEADGLPYSAVLQCKSWGWKSGAHASKTSPSLTDHLPSPFQSNHHCENKLRIFYVHSVGSHDKEKA